MNWETLQIEYERGNLKSFIWSHFDRTNPTHSNEFFNIFTECVSSTVSNNLKLQSLRHILQCMPLSHVENFMNLAFIEWISSIVSEESNSTSVRGAGLSCVAMIIKRATKDMLSLFHPFTSAIFRCFVSCAKCCDECSTDSLLVDIFLHQMVELLNGDDELGLAWLTNEWDILSVVLQILVSEFFYIRKGPSSQQSAVVDTMKIFTSIVPVCLSRQEKLSPGQLAEDSVSKLPVILVKCMQQFPIIHECFAAAFGVALDLAVAVLPCDGASTHAVVHHSIGAISTHMESGPLSGGFDIKRVDFMAICLGTCFTANAPASSDGSTPEDANESSDDGNDYADAEVSLKAIETLQLRLKGILKGATATHDKTKGKEKEKEKQKSESKAKLSKGTGKPREHQQHQQHPIEQQVPVVQTEGSDAATPVWSKEELKEVRACGAELRRSCIATAAQIIKARPAWIRTPSNRAPFWRLCIEALGTPLLFAPAFAALQGASDAKHTSSDAESSLTVAVGGVRNPAPGPEQKGRGVGGEGRRWLAARVRKHLVAALRAVSRYSGAVALDLVRAVHDLCDAQCTDIIFPQWRHARDARDDPDDLVRGSEGRLGGTTGTSTCTASSDGDGTQGGHEDQGDQEDLALVLLGAYEAQPRGAASDDYAPSDWKVSSAQALRDVIALANASHKQHGGRGRLGGPDHRDEGGWGEGNLLSRQFCVSFVRTVCADLGTLYGALGVTGRPRGLGAVGRNLLSPIEEAEQRFFAEDEDQLVNVLESLLDALVIFLEDESWLVLASGDLGSGCGQQKDDNDGISSVLPGDKGGEGQESAQKIEVGGSAAALRVGVQMCPELMSALRLVQASTNRPLRFEDDLVQLGLEIALIAAVASAAVKAAANIDTKVGEGSEIEKASLQSKNAVVTSSMSLMLSCARGLWLLLEKVHKQDTDMARTTADGAEGTGEVEAKREASSGAEDVGRNDWAATGVKAGATRGTCKVVYDTCRDALLKMMAAATSVDGESERVARMRAEIYALLPESFADWKSLAPSVVSHSNGREVFKRTLLLGGQGTNL